VAIHAGPIARNDPGRPRDFDNATRACWANNDTARAEYVPSFAAEQQMWDAILSSHCYGWIRRDDGRVLCCHHSCGPGS
jgi:hypothetical protein